MKTFDRLKKAALEILEAGKDEEVDNEALHDREDQYKNEFIHAIAEGRLIQYEISELAIIFDDITSLEYTRWTA